MPSRTRKSSLRPFRYEDFDDLDVSDRERELARTAETAQGTGTGVGTAIGTGLGTLAGLAPLLIPGAGIPLAGVTAPAGAAAGGALGGAAGSAIGGHFADQAGDELLEAQGDREEKLATLEEREEALRALLGAH